MFDVSPLPSREILEAAARNVESLVNRDVTVSVNAPGLSLFQMRTGTASFNPARGWRMTDDNRAAVWNRDLDRHAKVVAIGRSGSARCTTRASVQWYGACTSPGMCALHALIYPDSARKFTHRQKFSALDRRGGGKHVHD